MRLILIIVIIRETLGSSLLAAEKLAWTKPQGTLSPFLSWAGASAPGLLTTCPPSFQVAHGPGLHTGEPGLRLPEGCFIGSTPESLAGEGGGALGPQPDHMVKGSFGAHVTAVLHTFTWA